MATILIVEDDESMRRLLSVQLERTYDVREACDGRAALRLLEGESVDLIVADVMMPGMNGYDFVREVRRMGLSTPVIMATAKQDFDDKREGFAAGADDYMTKPLQPEELLWRCKALLRRAKIAADREIVLGKFRLSADSFEASYEGVPIEMARKEFELLYRLLSYPNRLFSKDRLMEVIWGYDSMSDDTTIRTHINRLRNKLEGVEEFAIVTVRGLGYKAVLRENA